MLKMSRIVTNIWIIKILIKPNLIDISKPYAVCMNSSMQEKLEGIQVFASF